MKKSLVLTGLVGGAAILGVQYAGVLPLEAALPPPPAAFELPPVVAALDRAAAPGAGAAVAGTEVDTSYVWAAFEAGDFAAVRTELVVLQRLNPGWTPPEDLVRLTDAAEARQVVLPAVAGGRPAEAVAYFEAHPGRFACADVTIEALWGAAEAYVALGRLDDAFAVHHRILDECEAADLRLATLEKAIAFRSPERFRPLIAVEDERAHEGEEAARLERIRRDALGGPTEAAPAGPVELSRFDRMLGAAGARTASAEDLAWLEQETLGRRNSNAAMVIGYVRLDGGDAPQARAWFERALSWRRNRKAAEGLFYALGRLGDAPGQQRVLADYPELRDRLAPAAAAGGAGDRVMARAWAALEAGEIETARAIAEAADGARPGERALLEGWARLADEDAAGAAQAFARAAADPTADVRASAEKGQALSLIATGRGDEVAVSDALSAADRADVELAKFDRRITQAYEAGRHAEARRLLGERRAAFPDARPLGLLEGWILFDGGDLRGATEFFRAEFVRTRSAEARQALMTAENRMYRSD